MIIPWQGLFDKFKVVCFVFSKQRWSIDTVVSDHTCSLKDVLWFEGLKERQLKRAFNIARLDFPSLPQSRIVVNADKSNESVFQPRTIEFQTRMTVANELIQCDMLPAFYVTHRGRTWSKCHWISYIRSKIPLFWCRTFGFIFAEYNLTKRPANLLLNIETFQFNRCS